MGSWFDVRERLFQFLKALERTVVPPSGCHHSITYCQFGNDGEERLGLNVWIAKHSSRTLFIGDGDLEKPAGELVAEVVALLNLSDGESSPK